MRETERAILRRRIVAGTGGESVGCLRVMTNQSVRHTAAAFSAARQAVITTVMQAS